MQTAWKRVDVITKATVRIYGKEYTITGEEQEEYLHRVAIMVDRKMNMIGKKTVGLSTSMIAVLSAVNLADDYLKAQDELDSLRAQVIESNERIAKLRDHAKALRDG